MDIDNPFDRKLETWGEQISTEVRESAIFVTDTLELCWASAQAIFDEKATPELALAIYDRVAAKTQTLKDEAAQSRPKKYKYRNPDSE